MTPQLQQAIKLLQLSNLELAAYVEGELERNPLLERDDDVEKMPAEAAALGPSEPLSQETPSDTADSLSHLSDTPRDADPTDGPLDTDYENVYNHDSPADLPHAGTEGGLGAWSVSGQGLASDGDEAFEPQISQAETLRQHLTEQLQVAIADPVDRLIGLHLIDLLDEAGYLRSDFTTAAEQLARQLGCAPERIEALVTQLQGFEPTGVFARSLAECLALQLAERNRLDPAMRALLDHLDLVGQGELGALKRLCGVDDEDLSDMLAEIRALNPKPASGFDQEPVQTLIPDVLMRPLPNGGWMIELNSETLPRVLVNQSYYGEVVAHARAKAEREYLSEHLQQANWLIKALHQRATTILKVAREIVRQQDAFFRKGVQHLRPLTLRDIAETLTLHESTVSRVTSNKYIATPRGIFEMKYFFTAAISGTDGCQHSAESVRHKIKILIQEESLKNVLSDDRIVEILRADGVEIARRTVAKYREAMRIPSSVHRRREKRAYL
jgi:RNA polymerase sigma-54 factor